MNRMKILQSYREKVIRQLAIESENRAKWLAEESGKIKIAISNDSLGNANRIREIHKKKPPLLWAALMLRTIIGLIYIKSRRKIVVICTLT